MLRAIALAATVTMVAAAANVVDIRTDTMVRPITIQNPTPR